ncbi:MAG: 6-carboxytetrahydropterin synthase [Nitrospirota bacterium]|nr:6-carboxytetrahydropterin synthase [Nitrospirota bacterium]
MPEVRLTKRIEFAAAHRYGHKAWDEARNRAVFGACFNEPGHGHNYMLEVTVAGEVDLQTGMVVNLYDLKQVLKEILEEFDHKHLNLDTPYFREKIPTTENIAAVLWDVLAARPEIGRLEKVRLFEDEDLSAEFVGIAGQAGLTKRYHFAAAHCLRHRDLSAEQNQRLFGKCDSPGPHGHNYVLHVTVQGTIDPITGMLVDIPTLDRAVAEHILRRFDHQDLDRDPDLTGRMATGENLARLLWNLLVNRLPAGRLARIGLSETRGMYYEYRGEEAGKP